MRAPTILLLCLIGIGEFAPAQLHSDSILLEWLAYKRQHGKSYSSREEEARRFANFMAAKAQIKRHNNDSSSSARLELNQMSDWDLEELSRLNGLNLDDAEVDEAQVGLEGSPHLRAIMSRFESEPVPGEVDWRKAPNRVGPVKDQARDQCRSGWAFAATGLLEGQQIPQNASETLVPLSEQYLVDCSVFNYGCGGGFVSVALDDIKSMGGIVSQADCPYTGQQGSCTCTKGKFVMKVMGKSQLDGVSEERLKQVVASYGPVAIAMLVSEAFMQYAGGIWAKDDFCQQQAPLVNHQALIVGYGTDPKVGDFWIVKNSWGPKWGEGGYFRIKRGANLCGITEHPTIATF